MILLDHKKAAPKIICDYSLEDTAHWLRAAGYDVQIPVCTTLTDKQLLDLALQEQRVLIIDKKNIRDISADLPSVLPVTSSLVYEQIKQVGEYLSIDWLYRPLTRCMICNSKLISLNINQWLDLPDETSNKTVTSHGCCSCKRIYWAGDEINRMVNQLESFKQLE